jgi:hypothetical protein
MAQVNQSSVTKAQQIERGATEKLAETKAAATKVQADKETEELATAAKLEEFRKQEQEKAQTTHTPETQKKLDFIRDLLAEYASKITRASDLGQAAIPHYAKFHGAFREMMALRGDAHVAAARIFIDAFLTEEYKALAPDLRYRHVDRLVHAERMVFTGYLDLLWRFTKCTDKSSFRKTNDIDRMLAKISIPALRESVNAVFP